ncbi:class I adenylate-forming enzyme family protein [Aurantimonas sp. HBX-1]|uniref:class I adenylate-forming enzyme family protein n=1 Tax=Aurantimonas sp. HBX-1 TaxID=2906072 RepID=UPI001F418DB1|nr:AMP-binding protein [Aurantimonas sp. HBX-1]UIJ73288.1 AMP-binding protein [Aurantimonas sp. HBX-1]
MHAAAAPLAPLLDLLASCRIGTQPGESLAFADVAAAANRTTRAAFRNASIAGHRVALGGDAALLFRIIGLWRAGAIPVVVPHPGPDGSVAAHWDWRGPVPLRVSTDMPAADVAGPDRLAIVHLSSGSTGQPRPAPRSVASLLAEAQRYVSRYRLRPDDRVLVAAPICHSFGFGACLGAAAAGATLALPATFNATRLARRIRGGDFDVVVLTAPMARLLVAAAGPAGASGESRLRLAIAGAGAVPDSLAADFARRFGCPLGRNYGSSETGATFGEVRSLPQGLIGRPFDGVRIVAPSRPGETGELVLDLGHAVLANGPAHGASPVWRTGDRASRFSDGAVRLHGRLDDRLKIDGRTIDGAEVATKALAVPGVRDAVALATAAPWAAGRDLLVVACEGIGIDRERVRATVAAAGVPSPRVLVFDTLPRTAASKPDRTAILAALAARERVAKSPGDAEAGATTA